MLELKRSQLSLAEEEIALQAIPRKRASLLLGIKAARESASVVIVNT